MSILNASRILITGACGTIGSELCRTLLQSGDFQPKEVIGIDHDETQLFFLEQEYRKDDRAHFFLADLRNPRTVRDLMDGVDFVFHTAACKHVSLCERSPMEAVQTNILGVQNVIEAALDQHVKKVIFTSSDKAVNPTNVMGTSKLMGERLITAANNRQHSDSPVIFASTRFGNVLGSSGSVIPIFRRQILAGKPVTLTHPEMTRFVMSITEAARLVLSSAELARGGEVFITKMPIIAIKDLARVMIQHVPAANGREPAELPIEDIGIKPGEKLYEELMNDEETRRALELQDYFVILPAFRDIYHNIDYTYDHVISDTVDQAYVSTLDQAASDQEIVTLLEQNDLMIEA